MARRLVVIGGGLAGCEAALMAARLGVDVELVEMKPARFTPAHTSPLLGELVCSNSLRSADPTSAVGLLKVEMKLMGSAVMAAARVSRVPAGKALAVDRNGFAAWLDTAVSTHPRIIRRCEELKRLPSSGLTILATGPLTTAELAEDLARITGQEQLHFYDAIAPIVTAESVDLSRAFWQDRYGPPGQGDYLNCPLTQQEYERFYQALTTARQVPLRDFEEPKFFEGCLPIEVLAARGPKTLLFGPMKPVGLTDPRTGTRPFAVVQLRKEDAQGRLLGMVGFQTKLAYPEQERVFRLIPALRRAEFVRLGAVHRNTFVNAPRVLDKFLRLKAAPWIMIAGQLSGVEGYVESAAIGMLCGLFAARWLMGAEAIPPPPTTAMGALLTHLANTATPDFQPSNINFGLFPPLPRRVPKPVRRREYARRAIADLLEWMKRVGLKPQASPPEI